MDEPRSAAERIEELYRRMHASFERFGLYAEVRDPQSGRVRAPAELVHVDVASRRIALTALLRAYEVAVRLDELCMHYRPPDAPGRQAVAAIREGARHVRRHGKEALDVLLAQHLARAQELERRSE